MPTPGARRVPGRKTRAARASRVSRGPVPRLRGRLSPCAARLEGLRWPAGLSFVAYGARIGVRVSDAAVLAEVEKRLPTGALCTDDEKVDHLVSYVVGGSRPGERLRRFHLLYVAAYRFLRTLRAEEALDTLERHLELAVAEMARDRLFVHAGVVGWKGRAILIPGRSHSGKSSLVAALLAEGADYLSDEYAVVDRRGCVHPYPRQLRLRDGVPGGRAVSAAELGARTESQALPAGLVAVTRYERGASFRPQRLTPGRAVMELLANSVTVRKRPELALAVLERLALRAQAVKGLRGEARETARRLLAAAEGVSR